MTTDTLALPLSWSLRLLERGALPDALVRFGIRRLLQERLAEEHRTDPAEAQARLMQLIARLRASPVAIHTGEANEQHYEVPSGFFEQVLGPHLKYSCLLLREGDGFARRCRGAHARAHRGARRARRRRAHPGAGLRLGFAVAVDGGEISARAHHRGLQFAHAEELHRRARRGPRAHQPRGADLRRQPAVVRPRTVSSTAWCRSRCSSTCATTRP